MICAEDEIGIGTSHDGIIVLPGEVKPGTLAKDYYNIKSDYVLEVDITPNRIDAASHYGVARDLAAYLTQRGKDAGLHRPSVNDFAIDRKEGGIDVDVANHEACIRYSGVTMRNVKVAESPDWLKQRLSAIGLRPINNVVDITNYILHATGQPLHCFDLNRIAGGKVIVKPAVEGEKFVTLDEVERTLTSNDLMICNEKESMCIAGVFGGLKSGVTNDTTDIFLESACFNPTWVRKTARRQGLNTDSSFRFERGVDPNDTLRQPHGCMVVDIGGGSTDIAVISMGGRVKAASLPVAGNAFDNCIAQYIQEKYQIAIGPLTAEQLKKQVACCTRSEFEGVMEVRGHSWETNLPARRLIYTRDLYEPVQELAARIATAARNVLESTPPELAADVSSTGVLLTGGGSLLRGLASYIAGELHTDVAIAPDPLNCVARGTAISLSEGKYLTAGFRDATPKSWNRRLNHTHDPFTAE